jgi:hypothetical protein
MEAVHNYNHDLASDQRKFRQELVLALLANPEVWKPELNEKQLVSLADELNLEVPETGMGIFEFGAKLLSSILKKYVDEFERIV